MSDSSQEVAGPNSFADKDFFSEFFSYSGHARSSCCGKFDHNKFAGEEGVGLLHSILAFHRAAHGFDSRHSQEFFS